MTFQTDRITGIPAPEPLDYDRQYSFTDWEALNPSSPKPAAGLEAEFNAIQQALDETQARARLIQRSDGALANQSVGIDQLKSDVQIGVNPPTAWAAFTGYIVRDSVVFNNEAWYVCLVAHTSGADFATDLAAEKWQLIFDFDDLLTTEVAALADAAEASALAAAASAASLNLPALGASDPGKLIVVNPTYDGYDLDVTIAEAATPSTVAKRDSAGRLKVATPSAADDAATKDYVDSASAIADGAVTTAKLADGAVTTAKLADDAVTAAKLAADVPLPVLLTTATLGAPAASIDFATVFTDNPGYTYYRAVIEGVTAASGTGDAYIRISDDGATFEAGTGYVWALTEKESSATTDSGGTSQSGVKIRASTIGPVSKLFADVLFTDVADTTFVKPIVSRSSAGRSTSGGTSTHGSGYFTTPASPYTGFQFLLVGANTAAGASVKVYGSNVPF